MHCEKKKEPTILIGLGNEENLRLHSYAHSLNNSIRVMLMKEMSPIAVEQVTVKSWMWTAR